VFSPEWRAVQYALARGVVVRFMDLPQAHYLMLHTAPPDQPTADIQPLTAEALLMLDPLHWLAEAAGYADSERWWEHMVEERRDSQDVFAAIAEAMTALRSESHAHGLPSLEHVEKLREAHMRKTIRAAQKEGFERVAVVCGAWHAPALTHPGDAREDHALLKGLPKIKVQAAWVPWTYGRLARASGYGAGIESPNWYHHLWTTPPHEIPARWMACVARLLREQDLDASTAQVIDALRLVETLTALRDRPVPGLPEMNEAVRAVFCLGDDAPLRLIQEKLIVGEVMGAVPDEAPTVPLQQDLQREQKRLRLKPEPTERILDLDLRENTGLERSHLLHRLRLLDIDWGKPEKGQQVKKISTFHEYWRLQWQPEFSIAIVEASIWGNTASAAADAHTREQAEKAEALPMLTALLDGVLLADLPDTAHFVMQRLQSIAGLTSDTALLMDALPSLADILRYGSVRQTDTAMIAHIVDGLVARICIGLPFACASLDDDAAVGMFKRLLDTNAAIVMLQNVEHTAMWQQTLQQVTAQDTLHGLIAGRCCRILLDARVFDSAQAGRQMRLALSTANEPSKAAAWVEGFLKGSGMILIHDDSLWHVLDEWVTSMQGDTFKMLLPLLRRTFATFTAPERRQMGERARHGRLHSDERIMEIDSQRADAVLPLLRQLLGVNVGEQP
jgi:hypothetical protein